MTGWAFVSNDEHLCVGCFDTEAEAVAFFHDHDVLADAGGQVVHLTSPADFASEEGEDE